MTRVSDQPYPQAILTEGAAPATVASGTYPGIAAGKQGLFLDTADHKLKRVNSSGTVVNIEAGGAAYGPVWVAKTTTYTLLTTDTGILGDATGGAFTITLPTAVAATARYAIKKKDSSANAVTIATTGSQTIDGVTTRVLSTQYAGYEIFSDGANWFVVAIPTGGGGLYTATIIAREEQVSGTAGGTFTSGAWRTRTLNVKITDTGTLASLATNQITIPAGNYDVLAFAPAYSVYAHQARIQNITDAATLLLGGVSYANNANAVMNHSIVAGSFTIAASKVLELQHQCGTTGASNGFGVQGGFGTEVYAAITLLKR